jgi:sarcosine oxidase, subunit alpha
VNHGPYRLTRGGLVDREEPVPFTFDGRGYSGFAGDTLASALLANGVRVVARSFKFHRPRGIFSAGIEEPHALVQLGSGGKAVPSVRAPLVRLGAGLEVFSQSGWPSVSFDLLRAIDVVAPAFAAGFYNKTFIWPSWHVYEKIIRKLAGLGRSPVHPDPDRYEVYNFHCDVLIVGGGVAGLRAALDASRAGRRVIFAEQDSRFGGQGCWDGSQIDGGSAAAWIERAVLELKRAPDVRMLTQTLAVGCYDHGVTTLVESCGPEVRVRERYWIVRTARVVLATGAIEQPLVFCNNDRPGVMLAGGARRYLACQAIAPGRQIVIATNNDSVYSLARELHSAGVAPVAVLDSRTSVPSQRLAQMQALSIPVHAGCRPIDTRGFGALRRVECARINSDGKAWDTRWIDCDALLVSGGWNPALHLFAQAGGQLRYREASGTLEPVNAVPGMGIVGGAATDISAAPVGPRISPGKTTRQWVDLLHDVTVSDLELAVRENFTSTDHVKRFTTVGMAADQGKTSSPVSLEILARLRGVSAADFGPTTLRPPFAPVTLGAIAGRVVGEQFAPSRRTPLHEWHKAHGAVIEDYGEWKRPAVYLKSGESRHDAIHREARSVRTGAGLLDGSTLGKIEIHGPDALTFLDRFYINNLLTLKPGRARYAIMLRESGIIFDDGTVVILAPDLLVITTTSGNAGRVHAWLEEWHQCEWPDLRVAIIPVTDQWATLSLTGSKAREILGSLRSDIDVSNAAFPHLGMREGQLLGYSTRIYRVSFTGELTYEINVPSSVAQEVWDALMEVGQPYSLVPFGIEALLLMRLEKGFLHIGSETDGTTVPDDVGWGKVAAGKAADFIGKRSLHLPEHVRPDRRILVGLASEEAMVVGSHVRLPSSSETTDGWITSAGRAVLTGEPIALAMVRGGRGRVGTEVTVHDAGKMTLAKIVTPPFFDAAGDRMNG